MAGEAPHVLLVGQEKSVIMEGLASRGNLHKLLEARDREAFLKSVADKIGAIAVTYTNEPISPEFMQRFPKLEQVSSFGVGYDHIDAKWAGEHGIVVTNTPEVLNEEVADTALGLLLCTVREFPQADRYVRAGKWLQAQYPLTKATLRNRTVGMVGMPHRQGDRAAAGSVQRAGGLSQPQQAAGCQLQVLPEARRHGSGRRHPHGHRSRRRGDAKHD